MAVTPLPTHEEIDLAIPTDGEGEAAQPKRELANPVLKALRDHAEDTDALLFRVSANNAIPVVSRSRFHGLVGSTPGDGGFTMHLTLSAPADFDSVRLCIRSNRNSSINELKFSVAASSVQGYQPKNENGENISFTPVTWGTTNPTDFRNPNGGSPSVKLNNSSGGIDSKNLIEGRSASDWISIGSLPRSDSTDGARLIMIRGYGVGLCAISRSEASPLEPNGFLLVDPNFYATYWAGADYTTATPPDGGSGRDWVLCVEIEYLSRGEKVCSIACAGDSIEQGWIADNASPQFLANLGGWPRKFANSLALGKAASYADYTRAGSSAEEYLNRAITGLEEGGITHLILKPWSVNDYEKGEAGLRKALTLTSQVLAMCQTRGVKPIIVAPYGGLFKGTPIRNVVEAYIDLCEQSGFFVFRPAEVVCDEDGGLLPQYLTRTASGDVIDEIHINEAAQDAIAQHLYQEYSGIF